MRHVTYHVHEDVSDHDHGCLVVVPGLVEGLQEVVVEGVQHVLSNLRNTQAEEKRTTLIC